MERQELCFMPSDAELTDIPVPNLRAIHNIGGALLRDMDAALASQFDYPGRYIFFTTYPGVTGVYVNDSHNMDAFTSDYSSIEAVRTMDKAVRGIRTYVTPELGDSNYQELKLELKSDEDYEIVSTKY